MNQNEVISLVDETIGVEENNTIAELSHYSKIKQQLETINRDKEKIRYQVTSVLKNTDYDELTKRILAVGDANKFENMSDEEIEQIFTDVDGTLIEFTFSKDKKMSKKEINDFRRDYASFIFNTETYLERLDRASEELREEMNKTNEEIKALFESVGGDVSKYLRDTIKNSISELESKETLTDIESLHLTRSKSLLKRMDEAITLEPLKIYLKEFDNRNILNDYKRAYNKVEKRYLDNLKKINATVDLRSVKGFENRNLPERYREYPDMLVFIAMRYIGSIKNINKFDGVFIAQLVFELRNVETAKDPSNEESIERSKTLLKNAEEVLEMFYSNIGK